MSSFKSRELSLVGEKEMRRKKSETWVQCATAGSEMQGLCAGDREERATGAKVNP